MASHIHGMTFYPFLFAAKIGEILILSKKKVKK